MRAWLTTSVRSRLFHRSCCYQVQWNWSPPNDFKPHLQTRLFTSHQSTMAGDNSILKGKYPAKAHCAKLATYLKEKIRHDGPTRIYLQGQKTRMIEDNDEPQPFRSAFRPPMVESDRYHILTVICQTAPAFLLPYGLQLARLPPRLPRSHEAPHTFHTAS